MSLGPLCNVLLQLLSHFLALSDAIGCELGAHVANILLLIAKSSQVERKTVPGDLLSPDLANF
ncbi:hypothetical protein MAR_023971 [Mya arenaria]|uniref:Uncharacterized protein n=1 Tax=Mya arenaria TaxID=6604 RepID=A0ABY7DU12_MYAAR|nr:hypothetical protein MAR_023971 [Mya arenaria]